MTLRKRKNSRKELKQWIGFGLSALIIIAATAYGFSLSLRPNSFSLESAPEEPLALIGVALTNNIGTDIPEKNDIPVNLPQDVAPVQAALMHDSALGENFFDEHFRFLSEFTEIVNLDLIAYLHLHADKKDSLDTYIQKLDTKKEEAKVVVNSLSQLHDFHNNAYATVQTNIKNAQNAIEQSYKSQNSAEIMQGIAHLEELHVEEQEHKTIVLFTQRIALEYTRLITLSEKKLVIIRANTEALAQGITVSLPVGSDVNVLKDLKLFSTPPQ